MNDLKRFKRLLSRATDFAENPYHPLVWINGKPKIGKGVSIGFFSEVNAKGASVSIGDGCDIASFVAINCADSHKRCLGLSDEIARRDITLEDRVFVGSHSVIKGGAHIGHHTVIAAGCVVEAVRIPPYSLVSGNPMTVRKGYYRKRLEKRR